MKFRRFVIAALLLAAVVSCDDTVASITDQLNLDRPIDVAFACYGGLRLTGGGSADPANQQIIQTAQPIQGCDIRSVAHDAKLPAPVPPGQETIGTGSDTSTTGDSFYYGFILQSAPGTVALAQWATKPSSGFAGNDVSVLDADPLTPGKNGISVGEDPAAIVTDTVGCYELTANAGSCDMSSIDISTAIEVATNNSKAVAMGEKVLVNRIEITNAGQPIRAKPRAMVAQPPGGTIGNACPATPTGLVYVAYPSCHLVAGIDVSTGQVVNGIQFDAAGMPTILDSNTIGNVTCADECTGGGTVTAGGRPIALALEVDARTDRRVLAIGSENSNIVTIVELDLNANPVSRSTVVLQQNRTNDLGVTAVAVSPTIGMGGDSSFINDDSALGGESQFVYAIATDSTVRVADIDGALNKECDTQIDPRFFHDVTDVQLLSCPHVGDPTLPPRRAGALGPGIQLEGDGAPTSIDIFKVDPVDSDSRAVGAPLRMIGYFGVITGSNGATYILNVDNDDWNDFVDPAMGARGPMGTAIPLDIANQLRDAVPNRQDRAEQAKSVLDPTALDGATLVPICGTYGVDPASSSAPLESTRFTGTFTRTLPVLPSPTIATEKIGILPSIRQVKCVGVDQPDGVPVSELSFAASDDVRDQEFPDLFGLPFYDENWTLTYEGSLSIDTDVTAANGPAVRTSQMYIDADGIRLHDQTRPFCDAGVEPYDIVQLRGCDSTLGDTDCPVGYTCFVHPESLVPNLGACMLTDEADRLANACKEFLTSLRQYTVGTTTSGELKLLPRKHVLVTTPVDGCTDDDQCHKLANYALQNQSSNNPLNDITANDTHTYSCAVDTARKPELAADGSPLRRCIETCQLDTDCDAGNVCDNGTCMEGVIPPQSCVNAPQRYELRASEAFAVVGDHSGYHHHVIADAGGNCIQDPAGSMYDIGRIPLRAPACSTDPTTNVYTGQRADGTFDPNPCEVTVDQTETDNNYIAGTCAPNNPATSLVTRPADAIRYRGPGLTLTLVDPTYAGDQVCIGDGLGVTGLAPGTKIPVVPPLYQESVRIVSGFSPLVINTGAAYPVKVRRGPGESIWVMDEGDYLSQQVDVASTRGKVFRIESAAIGVINLLQ